MRLRNGRSRSERSSFTFYNAYLIAKVGVNKADAGYFSGIGGSQVAVDLLCDHSAELQLVSGEERCDDVDVLRETVQARPVKEKLAAKLHRRQLHSPKAHLTAFAEIYKMHVG